MMEPNFINYLSNVQFLYTAAAVIILTTVYYVLKTKGLPPGPIGLPYFGYWPFLDANICHLQLQEMVKKYGAVCSFTVTGHLYVNLASMRFLREAFITKSDCFMYRNVDFSLLRHTFEGGVVFAEGEEWKILRKFFIMQLRETGFSTFKGSMVGPIYDIIRDCKQDLLQSNGEPVILTDILTNRCNSILRQTLFGERGITDQEVQKINDWYLTVLENATGTNLLLIGAIARYFVLPFTHKYKEAMRNLQLMENKIFEIIDKHKATYNEGNMRNIIDIYIKERISKQSRNDPTAKYFTDKALAASLLQFVSDGVVTVAVFVCSFFKALLDHPEEQDKIYQELIDVVGVDRDPGIDDKNKLPYTNAFIFEVIRTGRVFPFFPKAECSKETTIGGYRIPKGTNILLDNWSFHFNPNEYEEPNKFNPSRFITKEGKKRPELPVLFGIGKRTCMGESFAMAQAFLFVATIMKHFRLSQPEGKQEDIMFLVGKVCVCAKPREVK